MSKYLRGYRFCHNEILTKQDDEKEMFTIKESYNYSKNHDNYKQKDDFDIGI